MQVAEYWTSWGIDGWRLDVPYEIKTAGFWEEFRARVRAINPDAYLVGEIWGDARAWLNPGDRFDAAMNYIFAGKTLAFVAGDRVDPGLSENVDHPVAPPIDAAGYGDTVEWLLTIYPDHTVKSNLNLLGSHDTARSLTVAGGDVDSVVLAALLLFTHPGAPCVYYGDEIGMTGGKEPGSRGSFPWEKKESWNQRILDTYRTLIALRKTHAALPHGSYRKLSAPQGSDLYAFVREAGHEQLVVAVNAGQKAATASVQNPTGGEHLEALWGAGEIRRDGRLLQMTVPPRSGVVWRAGP
jgi:cyclomaltodextrinase/neopullulanase